MGSSNLTDDQRWALAALPLSDEARFRHQLARCWLYDPEALDESTLSGQDDPLRPLVPLLGPVAALQVFRPSAEYEEHALDVRSAARMLPSLPEPVPDDDRGRRRAMEAGAEALARQLDHVADRLRAAEEILRTEGWRLNREKWRVERVPSGHSPQSWRRELIETVVRGLRPGEDFGYVTNDQELREEVSQILSWFLLADDVDPAKDGPIDRDLKNAQRAARKDSR